MSESAIHKYGLVTTEADIKWLDDRIRELGFEPYDLNDCRLLLEVLLIRSAKSTKKQRGPKLEPRIDGLLAHLRALGTLRALGGVSFATSSGDSGVAELLADKFPGIRNRYHGFPGYRNAESARKLIQKAKKRIAKHT
jgi:hypothetical protein